MKIVTFFNSIVIVLGLAYLFFEIVINRMAIQDIFTKLEMW